MTPSNAKATTRMVMASFIAGAGAMVLVGLVAPVAADGTLSVREAFASQMEPRPAIEPLDVEAIESQLDGAERAMNAARARTDGDIARLARLSRR